MISPFSKNTREAQIKTTSWLDLYEKLRASTCSTQSLCIRVMYWLCIQHTKCICNVACNFLDFQQHVKLMFQKFRSSRVLHREEIHRMRRRDRLGHFTKRKNEQNVATKNKKFTRCNIVTSRKMEKTIILFCMFNHFRSFGVYHY